MTTAAFRIWRGDASGGQFADQRTAKDHDAGNRFDFFGIFCRQWPEKALTAIM